jgi:hypothetical protein
MAVATEAREPEVADLVEAPAPPKVPLPDSLVARPTLAQKRERAEARKSSSPNAVSPPRKGDSRLDRFASPAG